MVGMLICGLWLILGTVACWQIAFPLAYLIFLVPVGEGLVPPMMEREVSDMSPEDLDKLLQFYASQQQ